MLTTQALTANEARVIAALIEKERTTPDLYPLSLNALTAACNQKTSRDPVMCLSESDVQATLESLRERELVIDSYGASGRVLRYSHRFTKTYRVPSAAVSLLASLMLRGPQTINELRANCERLYAFADASSVEAYLEELAQRQDGALVIKQPRQAGAREQRWAHLLCGEISPPVNKAKEPIDSKKESELEARVTQLEAEVRELQALVKAIYD